MRTTAAGSQDGIARDAGVTRLDWLLPVLVLAVAVFFRFWRLSHLPPGMDFDEAFESLEARRLLTEPGYHPIFFPGNNGVPPLKIYLTAAAFLVAGEHTLSIRYVSAIVGTLTVGALYLLARKLFPPPAAGGATEGQLPGPSDVARRYLPFVSALILAVLPWHTSFSRRGIEVILAPLWIVVAILFLWQGLASRRRPHFALSGFFWGSAPYTYQAAWFMPGVLVLFLIYKVFQERGFLRRYGRQLLLLALVAIAVALPLGIYAARDPWSFFVRTSQTGVFSPAINDATPLATLASNAAQVAGMFLFGGDRSIADNIPLRPPLPFALALALLAGLLAVLRHVRRPAYALLGIWFVWMLVPSIITNNAPSIRRAIASTPAMAMLMALGMAWVLDSVGSWMRRRPEPRRWLPGVAAVAIGALLIYSGIWSYRYYFVEWAQGKELFHYFDVGLMELGEYANASPPDTRLYYSPAGEADWVHLPLSWQTRGRDLRTFDGNKGLVLAPAVPQETLYLITTFLGDNRSLPALQELYPAGRVTREVQNRYGVRHSLAFTVPPETAPSPAPEFPKLVSFEDGIELLGSSLSSPEIRAGDTVTVTLYWKAAAGPSPEAHTVFTHLLGQPAPEHPDPLWVGQDNQPVGNSYPTTRWAQGEIILDEHVLALPAGAPAGSYQVEVGWYTPDRGGARLKLLDATGRPQGDSVVVSTVVVP